MEAVPRLPMISFDLRVSPESAQFAPQIKQYIASFYNEDPESYSTEINNLESLRSAAVRPTVDVAGCQLLKKYYCQLHFLKSRFPMTEMEAAAVYFSWKDNYSNMPCSVADIRFELMNILYNIGALHTQLGAADSRTSPDGLKMACTHFQCAAWAFQTVKEVYYQMVNYFSSVEVIHLMHQVCLAQAQECILEKSMMDNRKATITAKVAVQVVDYYRRALTMCTSGDEDTSVGNFIGGKIAKEWTRYLTFKISYHKCIALLFQGQQAEEQQKMGERVAFYQAACEQLEDARKLSANLKHQKEVGEAIAFTSDVVEGKRKAAKNENEFIYHEEVPDKNALQEVKGASLVKGIAFNVNDVEVSGPDIFARLVPMEAHEASSLYSEKKAQKLRQLGELVEMKDQALAEFMSSLQLDVFSQMRKASGLPQDLVDRAAALSAKPMVTQELVTVMSKLSNIYHDVEAMLNEIQDFLKEEEKSEQRYQELMGKRPPSIIATDLSREAAKYREAHNKANDSNQNLHKAMTAHVANLKILMQPLRELQKQIPSVELPNSNIDETSVREIDSLVAKVDEMKNQRAMLWAQFRESVHKDDITSVLVTRQADQPLDQLFQQELQKHQELTSLIEQNIAAQENILKAFVDAYARSTTARRYLQDIMNKRNATISALIASYDTYEDLLAKANKGIDFYSKLETNVSKLLQRIKSACKVQQEEREQILLKNSVSLPTAKEDIILPPSSTSTAPKLKDYLDSRKKVTRPSQYYQDPQVWPPAVRPAPLGSEVADTAVTRPQEQVDHVLTDRMSMLRTYNNPSFTIANYNNFVQPTSSISQTNINKSEPTGTTNTYQPISSISQSSIDNSSNFYSGGFSMSYTTASQDGQPNSFYGTQACGGQVFNYPLNQVSNEQSYKYHMGFTGGQNNTQLVYSYPDLNQKQSGYSSNVGYGPQVRAYSGDVNPNMYLPQTVQPPVNSPSVDALNAQPTVSYPINQHAGTSAYSVNQQTGSDAYSVTQQTGVAVYSVNQQPGAESYSVNQQTGVAPFSVNQQTGNVAYPVNQQASLAAYSVNQQTGAAAYSIQSTQPTVTATYPTSQQVQPTYQTVQPAATETYSISQVVPPTVTTPTHYPTSNSNYTVSATAYQNYDVNQHYQYYYGANYAPHEPYQNYQNSYNYPAAETPANERIPVTTKESNVDLLTGLDFNVSQAPLIPQQKPSVAEVKPDPNPIMPVVACNIEEIKPVSIIEKVVNRKPMNNADVKKLFGAELDKMEKFVDALPHKTLSGPTNLDLKWKEIVDKQDVEKRVISVARCYPMKNRYPDILPYDYSRVELKATADDYINASLVKDISYYAAPFIITQLPIQSTITDFWTMIKEQQVELVVCLLNDTEIGSDIYWPQEKGRDLLFPGMVISLVGLTVKPHWIERLISISIPEKKESKMLIHLQYTAWPGSLFPTNPEPFAVFTTEIVNLYLQQRHTMHPIVMHCSSGIGRSGLTALLVTAILEVTSNPLTVPDLVALAVKLASWRRNILRDREHLKFTYEVFLAYMKQVVAQGQAKKVLNEVSLRDIPEAIPVVPTPVENLPIDPLSTLDPFWASKRVT